MGKLLYKMTLSSALILILGGCGGGGAAGSAGSGETVGTTSYKIVPMVIGEKTTIAPGYSIVEANDEAVVEIVVTGTEKSGTLMEGEASLKIPL